jgi:hypothetical protein
MFRKTLCGVLMVLLSSAALAEAHGPSRPAAYRPAPSASTSKQLRPVRQPGPPPAVVNPASTSKQVRPVRQPGPPRAAVNPGPTLSPLSKTKRAPQEPPLGRQCLPRHRRRLELAVGHPLGSLGRN